MTFLAKECTYSVFCRFCQHKVSIQSTLCHITQFSFTSIFYCLAYRGCNIKLAFTVLEGLIRLQYNSLRKQRS